MDEEDLDKHSTSQERIKRLGFKPQKELVYNNILPYADELDDESSRLFAEIKTYLGKNVLIKEMRPGCGMWTARLMKYIKLYGLKFSKEDHINLIYLVYELIIIPDLEPTKLHKFSTLLILLTKKKHLLTPKEVTLPWRPLYDIAQKIFSKSSIYHFSGKRRDFDEDEDEEPEVESPIHQLLKLLGFEVPAQLAQFTGKNDSLEATFDLLIYSVKPYFPLSATQEILDEIMPKFTPWNSASQDTIQHLMVYLPNSQPPEDMDKGFKLWFDDLMDIWNVCNNGLAWESEMMVLMANTAFSNIGYIDWEPHIPLMFTRFLRSFNLPVTYKQTQNHRQQSIDICGMALWIVSALGPGSSAQKYLDDFMTTVVTYLHSANNGRWSVKLRELVRRIPYHFVQRVHKQRTNYKNTWENKVPVSHQLTDDDITKFVECMLNVALQAMFSRAGVNDACVALQQLAVLRPSMVVAPTVEKLWNTLDSLTEPHKLTCAMQCVVAIARPLISGYSNGYPEGPTHVIPLLLSSLPGLDPNDFKKTLVTLHFISVFCTFIPLVDCSGASEYWSDLTEEEHTVCEATAQIEDFVLQYFDRVFTLVESSIMENTRMEQKDADSTKNKLEATCEGALASASVTVLMQTSTEIFKLALKKFHKFVTERILEINVAGMTAASLARAFARVNARETFKVFIPYLCDTIMELLGEGDEILKGERLDNDLLFNLLLLSHIVERDGVELLVYIPRLLAVLDKTLQLVCKEGYILASSTLNFIISAMCNIYPQEFRSSTMDYDSGVKNFLAIREWGKPGNLWKCDIKWHVPSEEEIECVQNMINRYLPQELKKLQDHMDGTALQTREEMHRSLSIVKCLLAANPVLPPLEEERVVLMESKIPTVNFKITTGIHGSVTMPDGGNVRKAIAATIHELQKQLLDSNEDDTKNLCSIIAIWDQLVAHTNFSSAQFENHLKAFAAVKRTLEDRLVGRPGHPRALLADRALLQQEFRAQTGGGLTQAHANVMRDLVTLSTSRYSAVRIRAQARLNWMISNFTYSYNAVIPQLTECLAADPETEHERLKGALYCLLGPKQTPLVTRHDWKVPATLWPAIVHSKPSEKLSVIRLLDHIVNSVQLHFPTITIYPKWSPACSERAKVLLSEAELNDPAFQKLVAESDDTLKASGEENAKHFIGLLEVLVEGAESTQLHWRHSMMCVSILPSLMHLDIKYTTRAVKLIMQCLIHDSILIRKMAVKLITLVLKQRKKKHKKVEVDPFQRAGVPKPDGKIIPGHRPDNDWLQFNVDKELTEEEWDKSPYLHKECYGFYRWPKPFQMYAPPIEQPEFGGPNSPDETDRAIYEFFSNKESVDKLIKFFTLEDKKGKDKFNGHRFALFKRLFRIYGDAFLPMYLEHLRRMVHDKQEAVQRCGAELLAGLLKGTKHWPYAMVSRLQQELVPIIHAALDNMTTENVADWGTCFATGAERMDPSRLPWVMRALASGWDGRAGGAGGLGGRLYALQAAVAQHPWRGGRNVRSLLQTLRENGMLWHPYQLIRERIASLMSNIFEIDVTFPGAIQDYGPSIQVMMDEIAPILDILLTEGMKGVTGSNNHRLLSLNKSVPFSPTENSNSDETQMIVDVAPIVKPSTSNSFLTDDMRALIKSTMEKRGLDKGPINMAAVGKIMQELKNSNLLNSDVLKDSNTDMSTTMEGMMSGFMESTSKTFPIVNMLQSSFASSLQLTDDKPLNGHVISTEEEMDTEQDSEYDISLRFFKTALKWVICAISRSSFGARDPYYVLMPAACALGSMERDEELVRLCGTFLSSLAQALHTPHTLNVALQTVEKVCESPSWCARASCLGFLQSLVFHNMALVSAAPANQESVLRIVLKLMADSRPEVRETAAQVMAGLLHCGVAENQKKLLEQFKSMCKGKVSKGPGAMEALIRRHCGVLGLCAFIAAHPYSVPPYLPEIFLVLGRHLNDPLPIPSTIRKTLGDFKRTHHDDWQNHQLKFTEDELCLLSDLTVPPSHYA